MSNMEAMLRLMKRVNMNGDCWEWQGCIIRGGYGLFRTHGNKRMVTHRFVWEFYNGSIPDDLFVCHHCDNPPCVRLDHLFLGTAKDNTQDAVRKRRLASGTNGRNASAKLNPVAVSVMRYLRKRGVSTKRLANAHRVSIHSVNAAIRGENYADVTIVPPVRRSHHKPRGTEHWRAKLTEGDVRTIRKLRGTASTKELGKRFGVGHATISKIHTGMSWKHL